MRTPAATAATHRGLIYDTPEDFDRTVTWFVREGLARGERVMVMVVPEKAERLRASLADDAQAVEFTDANTVYRRQGQATRAIVEYVSSATAGDRPLRLVAEQALARRTRAELGYYLRLEAAANVVYDHFPVSILCPYDASAVPAEALAGCEASHPELLGEADVRPNARFVEPAATSPAARRYAIRRRRPPPSPAAASRTSPPPAPFSGRRRSTPGCGGRRSPSSSSVVRRC